MYLSLVIPTYNEENKIAHDITEALSFLSKQDFQSEVLIVNDGSLDGTYQVIEETIQKIPVSDKVSFKILSYTTNRGKGYAVKYGVTNATGEMVAFVDSGFCVPFHYLLKGFEKIRLGADLAIASRRHEASKIQRYQPFYRQLGSKIFRHLVQLFMGIRVSDTQCGFKIYRQSAAKKIFTRLQTDGFMFDIEALFIAKRLNLNISEFGVEWSNDSDTRFHPLWGTFRNIKELIKIRIRTYNLDVSP